MKVQRSTQFLGIALLCLMFAGRVTAQEDRTKRLTAGTLSDAPSFAKRALVIGVGEYEHANSLAPTTYNDASRFAALLQTRFRFPPEAITLLTDAPGTPDSRRPTFIHLRNAFKTLLAGIDSKSEVVIYFSGHGTRAEDHDWLVPMDGSPSDVEATCINYDDFKSQLNTLTPARALLIVDACRNLSGGKEAGPSGFGAGKELSAPQFAELLSCRPKEASQVGKPEDFAESVFTHYLLLGLNGDPDAQENGDVTFDSLSAYVHGRVSQYVSNKYGTAQNPEGRASLGKMLLAKGNTPPVPLPMPQPPMPLPQPANPEKPTLPVAGAGQSLRTKINPKDGAEMVFIPAGYFTMGSNDDDREKLVHRPRPRSTRTRSAAPRSNDFDGEKPVHRVELDGYWMYKNVVTVGQYKQFCSETGKTMPAAPGFNPDWSKEDHPIVNVSWYDAVAYCQWAGVRLPSEAEWEKAARGKLEGKKYPWGDTFDRSKLWCSTAKLGDAGGTKSVGSFSANGYGLNDMAGNVWQWCSDWYDAGFYGSRLATERNPNNQSVGEQKNRVVRGGSWFSSDPDSFRCAYRYFLDGLGGNWGNVFGFRCASGQ